MSQNIPLRCLNNNCSATITKLCGEESCVHRLEEMGISSGCRITMICNTDPCLLKINNQKICLRVDKLTEIFVSPTEKTKDAT